MSINSGPTNNENPFYKTDVNYSALPSPFDAPNIRLVLHSFRAVHKALTNITSIPTNFLHFFRFHLYASRPSVLQSPPKQSPFTAIVTTTGPPIPMMQQPSATFSSMVPAQPNISPWKCPDWMSHTSNNELVEFNSQPSRMPFKRKASTEMDT